MSSTQLKYRSFVIKCRIVKKLFYILCALSLALFVGSCSPTKNTGLTRKVQSFKARYNTYFNGHEAFKDGRLAQEEGNKDNYTEMLPLYMTSNKATAKLGSSNFDRSIEKCQKTIKLHSITAKPKWTKNRPKTQKDKIWLSQKEYNPFLWKAWMLLGESQFRKGDYMEAASTFAYIERLYFSNPNIVARARLMEAKCYAELDWLYDAEDLLNRAKRDSFPTSLEPMRASVLADINLRQEEFPEAITNIEKSLKGSMRPLEKTRLYFLLGQLYHKIGHSREAYKYFKKVIARNPPYELEFNARIHMTEVMSKGQSKQMIRKLQSMAKSEKNKDYLDQVYYAIGNIYLAKKDTLHAIWAYKDGMEKSTRNGIEKGVVMMHLGQLYWDTEKFVDAQKCYSQVIGLLDKDRDDYAEVDERSRILDELLPFASAVELQDSMQMMAKLDSATRMAKIKFTIEELKKKEKEEEKKAAQAAQGTNNRNGAQNGAQNANNPQNNRQNGQSGGVWYFYNPTAVTAGKAEFEKKWGKRQLADDWRRLNKTVLNDFNTPDEEEVAIPDSILALADSLGVEPESLMQPQDADVESDSTSVDGGKKKKLTKEEKEAAKAEEYANDPHRPEYYLKEIPFTEEQMAASNAALVEGLYGSAVIYKDLMGNLPLAERTFNRILVDFPDFDKTDEAYYNMFQLYSRMERDDDAEAYKQKLISEYPENEHGKLIADPNFEFKARYGKQVEDSLYTLAYDAFQFSDYQTVLRHSEYTETEYPNGANRPRFMFLEAMSRLELGERDGFMNSLKALVEKYPQSSVSELAGLYVKGLKEGRLLASGKFEMGSVWERRRGIGEEGDSILNDTTFSAERNCDFVCCVAYERDSVDQNQLLFEMANYNFTAFTVRNFDLTFELGDGVDMLQVRSFLNYDEAYIYLHRLLNNEDMAQKLQGLKCFIISEDNLKKLMHGFSFADYFDFYDETFDRIGSLQFDPEVPTTLDEPTEMPEPVEEGDEEEWDEEEENFIF